MATIVPTNIAILGPSNLGGRTVTLTTLTGTADTFVYDQTIPGSVLTMRNPTGGAIQPRITGSLAPTAQTFLGYASQSLAAGLQCKSIAAGEELALQLDDYALWLPGVISITSGAGLVCALLTKG